MPRLTFVEQLVRQPSALAVADLGGELPWLAVPRIVPPRTSSPSMRM